MSQTSLQRNLETPGSRLKHIRSILRLTRAYIEKQYKLPEITLKSWENGTIKLSRNGVRRCVAVYKSEGLIVDEGWIADGKGLDPTVRLSVGHYFSMPSDANLPVDEDDEIAMMRDANDFKNRYPNAVVMIVSNDEMSPNYEPGEYIGGRSRKVSELEGIVNRDCIVCLKGGGQYFRRLWQDPFGRYNLSCLNPVGKTSEPVIFNVDIEWAAPVTWVRKRDK
jgi:hypothetical protein